MTGTRGFGQAARFTLVVLAAVMASGRSGSAQSATEAFGSADPTVTTLMASSLTPQLSTIQYVEDVDGWRNATAFPGPYAAFRTGLDVPTGAMVTAFELEACDTDPATDVFAWILQCGLPPQSLCGPLGTAAVSSNGTPGCLRFQATNVNQTVDNRLYSYMVEVWDASTATTTRFRSVRVFWKRQVSPPPPQATFADVTPAHFAFRYVEALARAGITGGCAPTQYCPDAPVTRAQMAVFLAVALGLHWPN